MGIYVVAPGDSVDTIASGYGVPVGEIIYVNQLESPYPLAIGQALYIPEEQNRMENRPPAMINGYAYPYISNWVLEQTLPFLTELSIFSYGFTPEGILIPPASDDTWMIQKAGEFDTRPILTLTPFGEDGMFNNVLIHEVVQSQEAVNQLIEELLRVTAEKGFAGVDVDFEYILAEDRDAFTAFVGELTQAMNAVGKQVSVAMAPKQSAGQTGLLYEGKDYAGLGMAANYAFVMTYEWGYTYGPPMAVAPIHQVRRVIEYAVTEIPPEKLRMGIPNYGYDWPLPYERGVTKATTIGNVEAVQIAIENGAEIYFDELSQSPYFNYERDGIMHEVWFEDVRSIQKKIELMLEFKLNGAGYWQIMRLFRANWLLLSDFVEIVK